MAVPMNIPTGCNGIDRILGGGIRSGSLTLIYGEPETGKTTFAMQCSVNCARRNHKVLFVDCDGTFSGRRLSQLASNQLKQVADLIILMRPSNLREQTAVVDKLPEYVTKSFGLLVVDTVNSLYRARIAESPEKAFELNRELNRQMAHLAQVARTQKIALLVTSQVRSALDDMGSSVEPVGSRVLKFWADFIVALKLTERPGVITAVLEKCPGQTRSLAWHLRIEEKGMHECLAH